MIVYTRWDSAELGPEALAVTFGRADTADADGVAPPVTFELYNSSGSGFTGTHYDPILPSSEEVAANAAFNTGSNPVRERQKRLRPRSGTPTSTTPEEAMDAGPALGAQYDPSFSASPETPTGGSRGG